MAILEVLHPVVGLVKTSVITTIFQVSSRLFMIWGVLGPVPRTQNSIGFILLLSAWSITEILRYRYVFFSYTSTYFLRGFQENYVYLFAYVFYRIFNYFLLFFAYFLKIPIFLGFVPFLPFLA